MRTIKDVVFEGAMSGTETVQSVQKTVTTLAIVVTN
jgi:hypothetical protein